MKPPKYDGMSAFETFYIHFHNDRHGKQRANADELSRRPTIPLITDDQQVQSARTQVKSDIPSAKNNRQTQSARALSNDLDLTDATLAPMKEPVQQLQLETNGQPTIQSATDVRPSSAHEPSSSESLHYGLRAGNASLVRDGEPCRRSMYARRAWPHSTTSFGNRRTTNE